MLSTGGDGMDGVGVGEVYHIDITANVMLHGI